VSARHGAVRARVAEPIWTVGLDGRFGRAFVATLVIGGHMALGFAFGLSADAYLLLGIPITIAFQALVVRRPLRALWLRDAPAMSFTPRSIAAVVAIAIAPAGAAIGGVRAGDPILVAYGLAAMFGALGAVYALRAMDPEAVRSTIRTILITGTILVGIMVAYRLGTGGFKGSVGTAVLTGLTSVATYLPAVFVMEEVLFRGSLDPYLRGRASGQDRALALYGSALWGIWHLPVVFVSLGILTIPYLVVVHTVIGWFLVTAWRRTGNLAAPGVAHAVIDALRNAVAVL
jgi:membrane protease YdiL (CAAX protease family)